MSLEDLDLFLPKFLSTEAKKELFDSLKDFPKNLDSRFYTNFLSNQKVIFQGDGLTNMMVVNLPSVDSKLVPAIVLSNTCDIDVNNYRNLPSQIVYSPIIELRKYISLIKESTGKTEVELSSHIEDIKKQRITQIFYLPKFSDVISESIVLLDRLYNIKNSYIDRNNLDQLRLFTLSDYGAYLFLFKISLHFSRVQDKVERRSNSV